jgi:hypothetical protein
LQLAADDQALETGQSDVHIRHGVSQPLPMCIEQNVTRPCPLNTAMTFCTAATPFDIFVVENFRNNKNDPVIQGGCDLLRIEGRLLAQTDQRHLGTRTSKQRQQYLEQESLIKALL